MDQIYFSVNKLRKNSKKNHNCSQFIVLHKPNIKVHQVHKFIFFISHMIKIINLL